MLAYDGHMMARQADKPIVKQPVTDKRVQSRLSDARVEELLATAAEVFYEKGYDEASVGEIAKRAKSSKGTFYSRYPTKELLFGAIIRRGADHVEAELASMMGDDQDVRSALRVFGHQLLTVVLSSESLHLDRLVSAQSQRFPELGRVFYESGPERMVKILATFFKQKTAQGLLNVAQPRVAAEQFIDMITGMLLRRALLSIEGKPTMRERSQRIDTTIDVLLKAYSTSK
jgi:TetR/AcrR family transcriptional repressor of mexJK operon